MRRRSPLPDGWAALAPALLAAGLAAWGCQSSPEPSTPQTNTTSSAGLVATAPKGDGEHAPETVRANAVLRDGPHGAMRFDEQEKELDRLLANRKPGPPPDIDPLLWEIVAPKHGEVTEARVALGRKLYFEPRLSKDGTVACATCHDVSRGFTDRRPVSEGIGGKLGRRNGPTTLNAAFFQSQFLDGRAATLEEQAALPIVNPIEMGQPTLEAAVAGIANDAEYKKMFQAAFGKAPNGPDLARAIADFERTLVFLDAPLDRFLAGDVKAVNDDVRKGYILFLGKARCASCHHLSGVSPIGTNNKFHNIGVSARHQNFAQLADQALQALAKDSSKESIDRLALETDLGELGRFVVTRNRADIGAFKTSQLRNVGLTAPYMHDGSMQTLWDVIDHYNKGGEANPYLDGGIEALALDEKEVDQLVSFLFALTDTRFSQQNEEERVRQLAIAKKDRPFRDDDLASRKILPFERKSAPQPKK